MSRRAKNRLCREIFHFFVVILLAWGVAACGGSKNQTAPGEGDDVNIDQLLGIEGEAEGAQQPEQAAPEEKSKDEDEVLRLLGITTDEKTDEQPEAKTEMPAADASQLQDEVNRLQTELFEKENIIEQLRKELNEKNERLTALQTGSLAGRTQAQPSTQPPTFATSNGTSVNQRYDMALAAYNAGRYKEAISRFNALLAENISSSLADNCQYWIGESYFGLRNYIQALVEFEKVFKYPDSNKADAATLKLGITYLRINDKNAAERQFRALIENYPKSEYLNRAQQYLANL